jgi:long-chain acyl-CoA synthetase
MPNLAATLAAYADMPERVAVQESVGSAAVDWSLEQLAALSARWQAAFSHAGLAAGDRIAISARNSVHWLAIDQAALGMGLVTVTLDPQGSHRIAAACIAHSGANVLLVDSASRASQILQAGLSIEKVVVLRVLQHGRSRLTSIEDFLPDSASAPFSAANLDEDHPATISYQRLNKDGIRGAVLSHANLQAALHAQLTTRLITTGERVLSCGSFSTMFYRTLGYLVPLEAQAVIALPRAGADLKTALADAQAHVLAAHGAQVDQLVALLQPPAGQQSDAAAMQNAFDVKVRSLQGRANWWDKLRYGTLAARLEQHSAAICGANLKRIVCVQIPANQNLLRLAALGMHVHNGMSVATSAGLASVNAAPHARLDTCGTCLPGIEAMISADGELLLRGLALPHSYWNDPAAAQIDFHPEGWVRTGYLAHLDGEHIMIDALCNEQPPQDTQQVPVFLGTSFNSTTMAP